MEPSKFDLLITSRDKNGISYEVRRNDFKIFETNPKNFNIRFGNLVKLVSEEFAKDYPNDYIESVSRIVPPE